MATPAAQRAAAYPSSGWTSRVRRTPRHFSIGTAEAEVSHADVGNAPSL